MKQESTSTSDDVNADMRRHLRVGWWSLLLFLLLGAVLDAFHAFKIGPYLDASYATRRLLWTLAHAHGTLLAIVNIVFGLTVTRLAAWSPRARRVASGSLLAATLLIPLGFFWGGAIFYSGDPGLGILLVPFGAAFLFLAVLLTARGTATMGPGRSIARDDPKSGAKHGGRAKRK